MTRAKPTFYVLHGDDEFTRSETLADFRRRLGVETADLNTTVLNGRKLTLGQLRHACDAIPFLADKRLVIVEGLLSALTPRKEQELPETKRELLDGLLDYLPHLPPTTRLVLVEDHAIAARHPILLLAKKEKQGYVKRFERPDGRDLPQWIRRRVRQYNGRIESKAAHQLAAVVGADLRLLDQEIDKLVTYAGPDRTVTETDVGRLVPYTQDAVIFDLVDALGHRDGSTASKTLHRLIDEGEHPLALLGMIIRQFRLLIQVKALKQDGASPREIAKSLGIHPFPAGKLHTQATHFTAGQLEKVYRHLSEIDLEIKTGTMEQEVALDLLVAGLATTDM